MCRLGKPGVEFYGHLPCSDHAITKLIFVPNQVIKLHIIIKFERKVYVLLINMIQLIYSGSFSVIIRWQ